MRSLHAPSHRTLLSFTPSLSPASAAVASRRPSLHRRPRIPAPALAAVLSRGVATSRRTVKALRTKPFPTALAASKRNVPEQNSIVFNPPPAAPSPYHTPFLFLPPDDPRRELLEASHAHENPYARFGLQAAEGSEGGGVQQLPPALKGQREKDYHLTAAQIDEIRALRASNPWVWTRQRLAEKFGCTPFFVGMVAQAIPERMEWAAANLQKVKERWGPKRRKARDQRVKRREVWARDE